MYVLVFNSSNYNIIYKDRKVAFEIKNTGNYVRKIHFNIVVRLNKFKIKTRDNKT